MPDASGLTVDASTTSVSKNFSVLICLLLSLSLYIHRNFLIDYYLLGRFMAFWSLEFSCMTRNWWYWEIVKMYICCSYKIDLIKKIKKFVYEEE